MYRINLSSQILFAKGAIMLTVGHEFEGHVPGEFYVESAEGRQYSVASSLLIRLHPNSRELHEFTQLAGTSGFIMHPQLKGFECHLVDDQLQVMVSPEQAVQWARSAQADQVVSYIEKVVTNLLR